MILQLLICLASVVGMGFLLLAVGLLAGWAFRLLDRRDPPGNWPLMLFVLLLARQADAAMAGSSLVLINYVGHDQQGQTVARPQWAVVGDVRRIRTDIGIGFMSPPGQMIVKRVVVDPNCVTDGIPCPDSPVALAAYSGDETISSNCPGITWKTGLPKGWTGELVFWPSDVITIQYVKPPTFECWFEFDMYDIAPAPPKQVEQSGGFHYATNGLAQWDAWFQVGSYRWAAGNVDNLTWQACPDCKCNQDTGECLTPPTPFVPHVVVNVGPTPTPGGPTCQWYPTADGAEMRCTTGQGWRVVPQ